jgi:serine protease
MRKWTAYARSRTDMSKPNAYMRFVCLLSLLFLQLLYPASETVARDNRIDRMIVKYKQPESNHQINQKRATLQRGVHKLWRSKQRSGNNADLYFLERTRTVAEAQELARELMQDPEIEYAEPDYRRYPSFTPNDPGYANQWYLKLSTVEPGAINAQNAWDETTGDSSIVIAVIDTGILPHEDIDNARVLPGYDFITDPFIASDTETGRDADPTDQGDWITSMESSTPGGPFNGCEETDSSWHGTKVSGVVLAATDNTDGIAGMDHQASLLPLRALGKCGGSSFDIADAIRWAAGLPVVNPATVNPNPADVINLSLGSPEPCTATEQNAINAAVAAGVVVVAAAGNDAHLGISSPANCANVIAVAATSRQGAETCYTNVGNSVDLSAPGGNDGADGCNGTVPDDLLFSTSNSAATTANSNQDFYEPVMGTSFATPLVTGAAALIKARANALAISLTPTSIEMILKNTAQTFPTGTTDGSGDCTISRCGEGILDVYGAVIAVANGGMDSVPNPFFLNDAWFAEPGTRYISNKIRVTGIDIDTTIRISGDGEYSIDGGDYTDATGTISVNQTVRVRLKSSTQADATVRTRLTIGGLSEYFELTTKGSGGGEAIWLLPLCALGLLRRRAAVIIQS